MRQIQTMLTRFSHWFSDVSKATFAVC